MKNFFVSETQNRKSHLFNQNGSYSVFLHLGFFRVIATINFYNQILLQTDEVCDIVINDILSSKFNS